MSRTTRREFLARSAAAGAVAGLCGFGGFHAHAAEPLVKAMPNTEKIGPRVKTFHLKDLGQFGVHGAKDVIWGQGKGEIVGILAAVKALGIKNPYFGIEWERNPTEPLETHARSAEFFEEVAGKLFAS